MCYPLIAILDNSVKTKEPKQFKSWLWAVLCEPFPWPGVRLVCMGPQPPYLWLIPYKAGGFSLSVGRCLWEL